MLLEVQFRDMDLEKAPSITTVTVPPRRSIQLHQIEIGDQIGAGGQAVVHKARVPDGDLCTFAVKGPASFDSNKTISTDTRKNFLKRAEIWAAVDARERNKPRWSEYNYITSVIETGSNNPWIAIEYASGGTLEDLLGMTENGIETKHALWIILCICRGLEVAHRDGITHLDLKPQNILFRQTSGSHWNIPSISDWGLARQLAEDSGSMEAFSYQYAAAEQFDPAEFGDPDDLTDVYQVGCLLYELLTGWPPYTGTHMSIMNDTLSEELPPAPSEAQADIPEQVDEIVLSMLQREKTNRARSIGNVSEAIEDVLQNLAAGQVNSSSRNNISEVQFEGGKSRDTDESDASKSFSNRVDEIRDRRNSEKNSTGRSGGTGDEGDEEKSFRERVTEIRERYESESSSNSIVENDSDQSVADMFDQGSFANDGSMPTMVQMMQQQGEFGEQSGFSQSVNMNQNGIGGPAHIQGSVDEDLLDWRVENEMNESVAVIEDQEKFRQRIHEVEQNVNPTLFGNNVGETILEFVRQYESEYGKKHPKTKLCRFSALKLLQMLSV